MRHTVSDQTRACALLVALVTTGCAPSISRFRYISLEETAGVVVEAYARPELKGLHFSSSIPVSYSLEREEYRLRFQVNMRSYAPNLRVTVESASGEDLRLVERRWRMVGKGRREACGAFYPVPNLPGELDFGWGSCTDDVPAERFISFDVNSVDGNLLHREDIPFVLVADGVYVLQDSL